MTNLADALQGVFATHEAAERGRSRDPHRTVRSIRRRRVAYAAGTGTAAAVGVGAVGAVWLAAPGGTSLMPGQPAPSTECTDAQLYLPPNPEALGGVEIRYRAYVDIRPDSPTHGVVVVTPDGTLLRVEPGPDGDYPYEGMPLADTEAPDSIKYRPVVWDMTTGGGGADRWDGVNPLTNDYEWTMVIPPQVPEGVNTALLSSTLRIAMGSGGVGYLPTSVPEGAVTDQVLTMTTGETEVARLYEGDPGISIEGHTDVASVAMRVTLESGETYTITAEHHEVDPALTACASSSASTSVTATPTGTPAPAPTGVLEGSSPAPGVSQGGGPPVLAGPESAVFACGAALPPELEGTLGLDVAWNIGAIAYEFATGNDAVAYGAGGILAVGAPPGGATGGDPLDVDGWEAVDDGTTSLEVFSAAVAVQDGVIIGVVPSDDSVSVAVPRDRFDTWPRGENSGHVVAMAIPNVDARMRACADVEPVALEGAEVVVLLGAGPIGGPYQFAWAPVTKH